MNRDCLVGLMCGLGIGVAVGMLTAPRSGEQTRAKLRGEFREGAEAVKDQANNLRNSATEFLDKGRQEVERQTEGISEAIEAGKQSYRQRRQVG